MVRRRSTLVVMVLMMLSLSLGFAADGNLVYESPLLKVDSTQVFGIASFMEQNHYQTQGELTAEQMVRMAQSSEDYLIVPGDRFSLSYFSGNQNVSAFYMVDGNLNVTIPEFGVFNCKGLSFADLKNEVQEVALQILPFSTPMMELVSCGIYYVNVIGEVASNVPLRCWGGSALHDAMVNATSYASSRDVTVTSADGNVRHYDLYQALETGRRDNDPLLRPGDVVSFKKADRIVVLEGAVYRPGTYQLKKDEGLSELIALYGNGLLPNADAQSVSIMHYQDGRYSSSQTTAASDDQLGNLDKVTVFSSPVAGLYVTVEGAIAPSQTAASSVISSSGKILYGFAPGEKVSHMLNAISAAFVSSSDLERMYIIRGAEKIILESGKLLSGIEAEDPVLQAGDKLIVPFVQTFVTVNGSVNNPGRIAYVPDKDASYYIGLSGGYSDTAKSVGNYKVVDSQGDRLDKDALIPNGAIITVDTNNFARDLAIAASLVSITLNVLYIITNTIALSK